MKEKIGQREVKVTEYFVKCAVCGNELTAQSESRLEWQLALHKRNAHNIALPEKASK